jgi:hypothetical protein
MWKHITVHALHFRTGAKWALGLKRRHGLQYLFPESPLMAVFEDGSILTLYRDRNRTAAQIAKWSKRDAGVS